MKRPTKQKLDPFAVERSNNAAKAANENSRPMAQYALLINGAAATAILALLSKENMRPELLSAIPVSLIFYALGVCAGALTMYFMTECLDYWNGFWELVARGKPKRVQDDMEATADRWWWYVRICFFASILFFIAGSGWIARALL